MFKIEKTSKRLEKDKIIVLVDGWGFNKYFYFIIKRFIPKDYGYLHYSYTDKILDKDPINTKNNIIQLIELVETDINNLISVKPRYIYLYGQSLGGLFCMIIADKINIKKIMLIAPGCNLAESFWLGKYTQNLKNEMIKDHHTTLEELKEEWKDVSPDSYFKNKSLNSNFYIILSKQDKAIPISNGKKLINILEEKNINFKLSWSKFSHKLTLLKELICVKNFKKWILK
ncbi:TPA: hypothetical protein DIC38_01490 [Candidatus Nomurabacteria bacterium]|nr:MAG: hypothetical protein O210_OD1C00001G0438 [Parcubacteria bacterium RAAC4_OD1_1]HCY26334.1 hypothetical protein [Candidatus Nomurabacteria bacterium]